MDVAPFEGSRFNSLLEKIKEVYDEHYQDEFYAVYWSNVGSSADGRDCVLAWYFDSWS